MEPRTSSALPREIRYCRSCQKETAHEIRFGAGVIATMCVPCLESVLRGQLETRPSGALGGGSDRKLGL